MTSPTSIPARFAGLYAAQFLYLGVQLPFLTALLAIAGLGAASIGAVTAAALVARLVVGPPLAAFADASGRQRRVQIGLGAMVTLGAAMVGAGAFLPLGVAAPLIAGAGALLAYAAYGIVIPMTDAAAMEEVSAGRLNYGRARSIGSAAFILANLGGGLAIARTGYPVAAIWLVVTGGAIALAAAALPRRDRSAAYGGSFAAARELARDKRFLLLVLAAGAGQASHATYYAFSILHWTSLGYSAFTIGALWATGVVAEIVMLANGRRLLARFSPAALIAMGGMAGLFRWVMTGGEPPLAILFALQLLHAGTFATTHLGSVEAAGRLAPEARATAMTVISTFGVGALTGLATLIAGGLYEGVDPQAAYLLCAGCSALAAAAALVLRGMTVGEKSV